MKYDIVSKTIVKEAEEMYKVDVERLPSFMIGEERGIKRGLEQGIKWRKLC